MKALSDPAWKGRICIRSSDNIYNQSLVASMIAADGVEATEAWAKGLVANMARPPIKAAIAIRSPPQRPGSAISPSPTPTTWPAC
jgi:ABC-type Fe3+ transport system substrate-binding protein